MTKPVQHRLDFFRAQQLESERTLENTEGTVWRGKILIISSLGHRRPERFYLALIKFGLSNLKPDDENNNLNWSLNSVASNTNGDVVIGANTEHFKNATKQRRKNRIP